MNFIQTYSKSIFTNVKNLLKPYVYLITNDYPYRWYFRKNKCIFIHIPKNAGTSILFSLSQGKKIYRDHLTWKQFYNNNPYRFSNYFKFSLVRNPFDRIVSTYTYLLNGGNQNEDLYFRDYFRENDITFEKFVLEYLDFNRLFEHMIFAPQYIFVYDHKLNLKVDFIGKCENIDHDFSVIQNKIKGLNQLKKYNTSKRKKNYFRYFSNERVIRRVVHLYKKDFMLFNYSEDVFKN